MKRILSWVSSHVDSVTVDAMRMVYTGTDDRVLSGDPPLCQLCSHIFSKPMKMKKTIMFSQAVNLKASAEIGCYLCSLLYEVVWIPRSGRRQEMVQPQRLKDIEPFPDLFGSWIDEPYGDEHPGCFELFFIGTFSKNTSGDLWQVKLLLVPENG